ncbi:MAG: rod shape-determining protein MreD [Anaerohalosphaeraceae bacterium]|nr:rod shape-determining protein MreD [Anaerohalosphaeraceae bacterium]
MRWLRFSMLILFISVVQASTAMNIAAITDLHIKPDILLIFLVYFAIKCETYDAVIVSFSLGFAADIISPTLGPYFLSFGIVGSALAHVRRVILLKTTRQQSVTIIAVGIVTGLLVKILSGFKGPTAMINSVFTISAVAVYSAIVYFLIRLFVEASAKWLGVGLHRFGNKGSSSK